MFKEKIMKQLRQYIEESLLDIDDNINTDIDFVGEIKKFIKDKFSANEIKMAKFIFETDLLSYSMLTEKSKEGDLWEEISQYIPEFNSEFFQRLTQDFPTLSVNERRLCAFLNLNLSTKEISEITRQSPHSINIARGRLRKKLGLTGSELSIQEFLTKYNQQTTEQ